MLIAPDMSARVGWLARPDVQRIRTLLVRSGLPVEAPKIGAERVRELIGMDKKVRDGRLRLVLLRNLGDALVTDDYPADAFSATLSAHFDGAGT